MKTNFLTNSIAILFAQRASRIFAKMWTRDSLLVPIRFLLLTSHLILSISVLWDASAMAPKCLTGNTADKPTSTKITEVTVWSAISVGLITAELCTFLLGFTMFHTTATLTSIILHAVGVFLILCIMLTPMYCTSYWITFALFVCLPSALEFLFTLHTTLIAR